MARCSHAPTAFRYYMPPALWLSEVYHHGVRQASPSYAEKTALGSGDVCAGVVEVRLFAFMVVGSSGPHRTGPSLGVGRPVTVIPISHATYDAGHLLPWNCRRQSAPSSRSGYRPHTQRGSLPALRPDRTSLLAACQEAHLSPLPAGPTNTRLCESHRQSRGNRPKRAARPVEQSTVPRASGAYPPLLGRVADVGRKGPC